MEVVVKETISVAYALMTGPDGRETDPALMVWNEMTNKWFITGEFIIEDDNGDPSSLTTVQVGLGSIILIHTLRHGELRLEICDQGDWGEPDDPKVTMDFDSGVTLKFIPKP